MAETSDIFKAAQKELARHDKPENKINAQRFFKERLEDPWMLKSAVFKKIANDSYKLTKDISKKEVFEICEMLLNSGKMGERGMAFNWAQRRHREFAKSDFTRFESWLKKHVKNWGSCDSLCCGAFGTLISMYPELIPKTRKWAKSKNRWLRRASAVVLILSLRDKRQLKDAFKVADILLLDEDDMVQKGYGWMLKEAGNKFPDEVFKYVLKHKKVMPRTSLRYAIEKYPAAKRKEAMKKD